MNTQGIHYIERRDDDGWLPLHQASKIGNAEIIHRLIQCKVSLLHQSGTMTSFLLSRCCYSQHTPIHIAILYNRSTIIEILVEAWLRHCDESISSLLTAINAAGYPPIHSAIRAGYSNVVKTLFRIADEHQVDISKPIFKDQSLFYSMAQCGHVELLDILYSRKNLANAFMQKDKYGRTLLHLATSFGHLEMVEALLNFVQTQKQIDFREYIDSVDGWGQTPLHAAILGQHVKIAAKLIHRGSLAIDRFDLTGMTPLIGAISRHCVEGVEMLIQRGSQSINIPSMSNQPPIYWATHWRVEHVIEVLKAVGVDTNISPATFYPFQYDILMRPISEEKVLMIRHRIYFAPSLTERLLFW